MSSAKSVARELLRLPMSAPGPAEMTEGRLQGLLYYAQGWSLVLRDSELFPDEIECAEEGPVVPAIRDALEGLAAQVVGLTPFDHEPNLDDDDEALFLRHLWAAYGPRSLSELLASIQGEAPFLEAKKDRERGGKGLIGMNELGELFSRRYGLPAPLDEYRRLREAREKEAELAILNSPPLDVEAIWKACRSVTPSAGKR